MQILHLISSLDPAYGGPPVIAASLAAAQAELGHKVVLATIEPAGPRGSSRPATVRLREQSNLDIRWLPASWLGACKFLELQLISLAAKPLAELVVQADIVHMHCVWDVLAYAAARECRGRGRPYCVLLNGMLDPWQMRQKYWKKKLALACGYRRMLDCAAFLHLGNEDERKLIEPLKLAAPGEIIPNGVFLEDIEPLPPRGEFYTRHPELNGRPFVLFLGRLHFKKGLDYLSDAFTIVAGQARDVQLVVAGPDQGEKETFERRIAQAGLNDRVHMVGPIYGADKLAALVDCACFCLPSRQEGFSMAITEALASGAPVVISQECHFPEVAAAGAGEVVPLSAQAIAGALLRVLSDEELRSRMAIAGRELVKSQYTWQKIARRSIDAYQRLGKKKT